MVNESKNYSCCIIGHRTIDKNINLTETLVDLIKNKNISEFKFGFYGEFNDLCYKELIHKLNLFYIH